MHLLGKKYLKLGVQKSTNFILVGRNVKTADGKFLIP
jgi:hypothetical protein